MISETRLKILLQRELFHARRRDGGSKSGARRVRTAIGRSTCTFQLQSAPVAPDFVRRVKSDADGPGTTYPSSAWCGQFPRVDPAGRFPTIDA